MYFSLSLIDSCKVEIMITLAFHLFAFGICLLMLIPIRFLIKWKFRYNCRFYRARRLLQEREEVLLFQLDEIKDSYKQQLVRNEQRRELLATRENLQSFLKGNQNQETLLAMLAPLEDKLREMEGGIEELQVIKLNWSREGELESLLKDIGTFKLSKAIDRDYTRKGIPVLTACKYRLKTTQFGEFNWPTVIAIQPKTDNLYIADTFNHRVQVFNKSCEFVMSFSTLMDHPIGICFHGSKILVTQFVGNIVNMYTTDGELVMSIGSRGEKELEFEHPLRICISECTTKIYICDYGNDRVQVLNSDFTFNSFMFRTKPRDVKARGDQIYILNENNPCLHVYNYEHQLIRDLISFGNETSQIYSSDHFCIDHNSNILISDRKNCCVVVFNKIGNIIHKFGRRGSKPGDLIDPRGIVIDREGRIIVASLNPDNCIQFF
ncbi:PEP-CTERM domain protein [Oopsacas minuta]|uniref:PEP-CTERM domain protein n=1 Tax=Oopsacas minuta TaxID=111878 RepID=A0AAV7K5S7_9METZ|nr:PEP-CTERM domain protein [Oopsacas minuta]